jgi:hypothetical protein
MPTNALNADSANNQYFAELPSRETKIGIVVTARRPIDSGRNCPMERQSYFKKDGMREWNPLAADCFRRC